MQWLDTRRAPAALRCTYCGTSGDFAHHTSFSYMGRDYALYCCPLCASLIYDPPDIVVAIPKPYTEAYKQNIRVGNKYYLESGYSADFIARCGLAAMSGVPQAAWKDHLFVDVGAGLGLGSYLIQSMFDIETLVIEPSYTGELGRELLGIEIHNAYFEHLPADVMARLERKPTLLHLNSVIEHLRDPGAVIRELMQRTRIEVIAAIVPDAAAIDTNASFTAMLPYLAPGDHLHLPTAEGMRRLFHGLGFAHCEVRQVGALLMAVGAQRPIASPSQAEIDAARDRFLAKLVGHPNVQVAGGAAARLLPLALATGDEALLGRIRARFAQDLDAGQLTAMVKGGGTWAEIPFHLGPTAFWLAVDAFSRHVSEAGYVWLDLVEAFAERIAVDYPPYSMQSLDFKWESRMYRAHFLAAEGRGRAAAIWLESVVESAADAVRGARPEQVARARVALEAVLAAAPGPLPASPAAEEQSEPALP
ncbi:class I SAM-dependent methyltransferase [Limobrevibacterium gyesilva]|uniref:Class I SAM-dependent methyltransferase n=1 Tax=Limobrevibacterium gyesilva TaxID=2991712 RepID=A0AA41YPG9_9PROT|nr:class I SAM-dependent methyltransferase [Limobrevibacterium gyesilva]MCW3477666.1 class I SAM-dependent methyltransferase [Limobrevibacterium gyesilva]